MTRTALLAVVLPLACLLPACDVPQSTVEAGSRQPQRPESEPAGGDPLPAPSDGTTPITEIALPVDDGSVDGLVVIQWQLFDNQTLIESFFAKHQPTVLPKESLVTLRSNGIACAQLPLAEVGEALGELGGTYSNVRTWLGEATQWHQVTATPVRGSTASVVAGQTRRLKDGLVELRLRGWTVPLEVGAVTDIEVACTYLSGGEIPGAYSTARERFASAGFFASLPRGQTLLLAGMDPKAGRSGTKHGPSAGPPVAMPPTVGEMLLGGQRHDEVELPRRRVIVIIPLISKAHFTEPPVESPSPPTP